MVFDEYHFLQDPSRGSAWEEAIILTPPNCQLLLLSASVANAEDFAAWLGKLSKRPARLVQTLERPVPLEDLVYVNGEWLLGDSLNFPARVSKDDPVARFPVRKEELADRLQVLPDMGLSPCIIYAGRRAASEEIAAQLGQDPWPPARTRLSANQRCPLREQRGVRPIDFLPAHLKRFAITYGVGFHHSGLAPQARIGIETLVKDGLLRFCSATMGLSIGINFSVRSALISDYKRPSESGLTEYDASEVLQMLGRAGRRGRDAVGFSLWPSWQSFAKFGGASRDACFSQLRADPTTFLGLVGQGYSMADIERFYGKSFSQYKTPKGALRVLRAERL